MCNGETHTWNPACVLAIYEPGGGEPFARPSLGYLPGLVHPFRLNMEVQAEWIRIHHEKRRKAYNRHEFIKR